MNYYSFLIREGGEIVKRPIVQAESMKNSENILYETHIIREERGMEIMSQDNITHQMGEKQQLQEFLNEMAETYGNDMLICTGGKGVSTLRPD
jgi:arabinogalactan endo-1,4-beta-galactosidase